MEGGERGGQSEGLLQSRTFPVSQHALWSKEHDMGAITLQKEGEHTRAKSFASAPELMMSPRCTKPLLDERGSAYLQIVALLVTWFHSCPRSNNGWRSRWRAARSSCITKDRVFSSIFKHPCMSDYGDSELNAVGLAKGHFTCEFSAEP